MFLVSNLFKATYIDSNQKPREGYFSYRLDFRVENQAGRFNSSQKLQPWVFLHLSCQRYAHEPLESANYDRDISVLMGMNESRLSGYDIDSTLVRLVVKNDRDGQNRRWHFQLPELLSAFKARELINPSSIFDNPFEHMGFDSPRIPQKDEYYIVHAEGYKYKPEKRERNHSLKTGFSFKERGDIISQILKLLDGALVPDKSIVSDKPTPKGNGSPLALRDYRYIAKPKTFTKQEREALSQTEQDQQSKIYRQKRQIIAVNAFNKVMRGEIMHLFLLWYEQVTYDMVFQQLRQVFLLGDDECFPENIKVHSIHISDATLLGVHLSFAMSTNTHNQLSSQEVSFE